MPLYHTPQTASPVEKDILHIVEETITTHGMFQKNDGVLVGVSGGPDSIALIHILLSLAPRLSIRLGMAHLNHCLRRRDSDDDAAFVASLARELDLPCFMETVNVSAAHRGTRGSLEETARNIRYAFFKRIADKNGFNKIATGHHLEDNAEVMIMDLVRGSGPRGMSGIPPVRDGVVVRPLSAIPRSMIHDYLKFKGLSFRTDVSNQDMRYLRNRVRHQLIPLLKSSYNPNIVETLNRLSLILRSEESWIDDMIESILKSTVLSEIEEKKIILSASEVNQQHIAARRRIIRKAIFRTKGNLRRIRFSHIESIVFLLKKKPAYGSLDLPDRIRVTLTGNRIIFTREVRPLRTISPGKDPYIGVFSVEMAAPGQLPLPNGYGTLIFSVVPLERVPVPMVHEKKRIFVDMDKVRFPLTVRTVQPGDRFVPLGMTGSQKISTFFINHKIPRPVRAASPVVVDREGRVIWLAGHRMDDAFRVTPSTQNVLKGELFLA